MMLSYKSIEVIDSSHLFINQEKVHLFSNDFTDPLGSRYELLGVHGLPVGKPCPSNRCDAVVMPIWHGRVRFVFCFGYAFTVTRLVTRCRFLS